MSNNSKPNESLRTGYTLNIEELTEYSAIYRVLRDQLRGMYMARAESERVHLLSAWSVSGGALLSEPFTLRAIRRDGAWWPEGILSIMTQDVALAGLAYAVDSITHAFSDIVRADGVLTKPTMKRSTTYLFEDLLEDVRLDVEGLKIGSAMALGASIIVMDIPVLTASSAQQFQSVVIPVVYYLRRRNDSNRIVRRFTICALNGRVLKTFRTYRGFANFIYAVATKMCI